MDTALVNPARLLPAELLRLPAWHGARVLLAAQLDELKAAHGRFPGDDEALHDFRVALRRLRSALTGWRTIVEPGMDRPGLSRGRWRSLAQATSVARDAEVQRALLDEEAGRLGGSDDAAMRLLMHEQAVELRRAERAAYDALVVDWPNALALVERLRARLRVCRIDLDGDHPLFGVALGQHLQARVRMAEEAVAAVDEARLRSTAELMERAHRLRIAVKHVRYTLDPIGELPAAAPLLKMLKRLQDALGLLHDVAIAEARPATPHSFARPASATADEAARRLRAHWAARRVALFAELDAEWLKSARTTTLWNAIRTLARELAQ